MKLQEICDDVFGLILDYLDLKNINDFLDSSLELEYYKNYFYCIILDEYETLINETRKRIKANNY